MFKDSHVDLIRLRTACPRLQQVIAINSEVLHCFSKGDIEVIGACENNAAVPSNPSGKKKNIDIGNNDILDDTDCLNDEDTVTALSVTVGALTTLVLSYILRKLYQWLKVKLGFGANELNTASESLNQNVPPSVHAVSSPNNDPEDGPPDNSPSQSARLSEETSVKHKISSTSQGGRSEPVYSNIGPQPDSCRETQVKEVAPQVPHRKNVWKERQPFPPKVQRRGSHFEGDILQTPEQLRTPDGFYIFCWS